MKILRVKVQYPDGGRGIIYCETEAEIEDMKSEIGVEIIEVRDSSETEMKLEQKAILGGFHTMESLAAQENGLAPALKGFLGLLL